MNSDGKVGENSHTHERQPKSNNRLGESTLTHTVCKSAKVNNRVEAKHSGRKYIKKKQQGQGACTHGSQLKRKNIVGAEAQEGRAKAKQWGRVTHTGRKAADEQSGRHTHTHTHTYIHTYTGSKPGRKVSQGEAKSGHTHRKEVSQGDATGLGYKHMRSKNPGSQAKKKKR